MFNSVRNYLSSLRSSLSGPTLDGAEEPVVFSRAHEAMLAALDECGIGKTTIRMRIEYAPSLQALWYLRPELMTLLSLRLGEKAASKRMATITRAFDGLLPSTMSARSHASGDGPEAP